MLRRFFMFHFFLRWAWHASYSRLEKENLKTKVSILESFYFSFDITNVLIFNNMDQGFNCTYRVNTEKTI